jgi:DNA topoisomerase VI subunit B
MPGVAPRRPSQPQLRRGEAATWGSDADDRPARRRAGPLLERVPFKTSRLAEFVGQRELVAQTGHAIGDWPLVILKELVDNALDECEEAEIAPEIEITVTTDPGEITVSDNGRGLPAETLADILDYSYRVSSREAYCSPTRGAQGNALKTLLAMPRALDGTSGTSVIEARGERHIITFRIDQLRQEPVIDRQSGPLVSGKKGTSVCIGWPDLACSVLADAKPRFLQIADNFGWLNPHLSIRVEWDGEVWVDRKASDPMWRKWRACDPTSPHWYDIDRLQRYIAAHVARDQDHDRDRTVREFISELRGFSGSAKQRLVLAETGLARAPLAALFEPTGEAKSSDIERLRQALQKHSQPVKPKDLGLIGKDHLLACFTAANVESETFKYQKRLGEIDGLPWVVETAFGWCPELGSRRIITGVNWSVGLGNPFRAFRGHGGEGLESVLAAARAGRDEPIAYVLHFTCPRVGYTDRGKSAVILPGVGQ